ncbi:hypothetical protein [Ruania albidiflava]|uniref:hypothetical protein n=1 Tax=Ruania albidiflava TaxID=366586 RepID=UPI0023F21999|nr:hypothetical protein [Ruania albidiflava]
MIPTSHPTGPVGDPSRREEPALTRGAFRALAPRSRTYFAWLRTAVDGSADWLIEVNLTSRTIRRPRGVPEAETVLGSPGGALRATLTPYECRVARVTPGNGHAASARGGGHRG